MEQTTRNAKTIWTIVWFVLFLLATIVLIVEACLPGPISSAQSDAVGNTLADFLNGMGGGPV